MEVAEPAIKVTLVAIVAAHLPGVLVVVAAQVRLGPTRPGQWAATAVQVFRPLLPVVLLLALAVVAAVSSGLELPVVRVVLAVAEMAGYQPLVGTELQILVLVAAAQAQLFQLLVLVVMVGRVL